jgi:hypothetical protein
VRIPAPRYALRPGVEQDRSDLACTTCGRTIAYGVTTERIPVDSGFYLEMHRPFCMAVHA